MSKQEPISRIAEILELPDNGLWEYEMEVNWEIIRLDFESIQIIKKELNRWIAKNAIFKDLKKTFKR